MGKGSPRYSRCVLGQAKRTQTLQIFTYQPLDSGLTFQRQSVSAGLTVRGIMQIRICVIVADLQKLSVSNTEAYS